MHLFVFMLVLAASPETRCPEGTALKERISEGTKEQWCAKPDGIRDGRRRAWYPSGQLWFEGSYEQGKRVGTWKFWYESGKKMSSGTYKDDQLDGLFTRWHETGKKALEGRCKAGVEDGTWTRWWPNGAKELEVTFQSGKVTGKPRYSSRRGQPVSFETWIGQHMRGATPGSTRFERAVRLYAPTRMFGECSS